MESVTYLKNIKISPKKMRFMLDEVKRMMPNQALDYLKYSPKKEAKIYYKALHSAIHNAINTLKVDAGVLQFKLFTVEEGRVLRRYRPGSRGSAKPIKRRYSHIKMILEATEQKVEAPKKTDKKTTEAKKQTEEKKNKSNVESK